MKTLLIAIALFFLAQSPFPSVLNGPAQASVDVAATYQVRFPVRPRSAATGYQWAVSPSATVNASGSVAEIAFSTPGSYTVSVTGTVDNRPFQAQKTVIVQ